MIRTVVVTLLVFLLGSTVEYRYNIIQKLPLGTSLKKSIAASDLPSSQLATLLNTSVPSDRQNVDFGVFWQAWNILEAEYNETEKIDPEKMVDGAVAGMVASLGDPYTSYLPPEDKVRSGEDLAGSFFGVGIELGYVEGVLAVVAPIDGTPAGSADVEAGDLIINVKDEANDLDESTNGWSLTKAVDLITTGLEACLDKAQGGEIAENLAVIYDWANREIMLARLRRDPQMLQGVINAMQPLAEAWREHAGLTNDLIEAANQPMNMAGAEVRSVGSAMAA